MTPNEFVREQWKVYEEYRQSKERLVEVATTLYLAFVGTLLLKDAAFWSVNVGRVFFVWLGTAIFGFMFVTWQMGLRSQATRISEACQSLMGEWLTHPPTLLDPGLEPEGRDSEFSRVKLPKALWAEMDTRRNRQLDCCDKVKARLFAVVVYGLMLVWTLALVGRIYLAWTVGS